MKCSECRYARQVGDKSRQDIVGCALLSIDQQSPHNVENSKIYKGYIYEGRRVGDTEEDTQLGRGMLAYGFLTEVKGYCNKYEVIPA